MIDPKSLNLISISKSISKPNFIFFGIHLLFFWIGRKPLFLDEPEFSKQANFSSPEKIAKKILKNIKFSFLIDFDMKITLNGLDRSCLT
jgi:hypothetical protein